MLEQESIINEYNIKLKDLANKEQVIFESAKQKGEEYLKELKEKASNLIQEIEETKKELSTPKIADIKYKVNNLLGDTLRSEIEEMPINVNDIVLIKAYNQEGLVVAINKNKYRVQMNNITLDFKKEELKFVRKHQETKVNNKNNKKYNTAVTSNVKKEGKMQLDLRGVRYEEVDYLLDKFIDNALLSNISQVTIIHGYGTGAVRKAVQEYIRKSSVIKSSRFGKEGEGLMGATVCTLK